MKISQSCYNIVILSIPRNHALDRSLLYTKLYSSSPPAPTDPSSRSPRYVSPRSDQSVTLACRSHTIVRHNKGGGSPPTRQAKPYKTSVSNKTFRIVSYQAGIFFYRVYGGEVHVYS